MKKQLADKDKEENLKLRIWNAVHIHSVNKGSKDYDFLRTLEKSIWPDKGWKGQKKRTGNGTGNQRGTDMTVPRPFLLFIGEILKRTGEKGTGYCAITARP